MLASFIEDRARHETPAKTSQLETMKIECPSCQQHIEVSQSDPPKPASKLATSEATRLSERASSVGLAGTMILMVSLIAILIAWKGDSDIRPAAGIVAGGCFFFALFLFLIAQLIYIRAALEK